MRYQATLIFCLLMLSSSLSAAAQKPPALTERQTEQNKVEASIPSSPLTFEAFINQVKQNHPALKIADVERRMASARRLERQGAFDPSINSGTYFNRYNSATQLGEAKEAIESQTTVDMLTRYGARLSAGGKLVAGDITPPLYPTGETGEYFLEMRMPLLRGRGINAPLAAERRAFLGEDLAQAAYERQRLSILMKASDTYWKWLAAHQKREVAQQLLELSQIRLKAVQVQAEHGDLPAISAVEAQQEQQRRLGRLHAVIRDLQQATYNLSFFLWDSTGIPSPYSDRANIPSDMMTPVRFEEEKLQEAKLLALQLRPELRTISVSTKMAKVDQQLAKNNLLPQLDAFINTGYETGQYNIGPTIRAGITIGVPLRQRTAQGQLQQAELSLERVTLEEQQMLRQIFLEIADSLSAINAAYERYQAAVGEWEAAKRMEQGERISFEEGESTLFLVNQRERATAEARLQVIEALADYNQARATLQTATGELSQ